MVLIVQRRPWKWTSLEKHHNSNPSGSLDSEVFLRTGNTSVGESGSLSVFVWMKWHSKDNFSVIAAKNYYFDDAATSPYFAWDIRFYNSANQWFAEINTGGTIRSISGAPTIDQIESDQWVMLGFTYDATSGVFCIYKNSEIIGNATFSALPIDYGTHGSYVVGADCQYTPRAVIGLFDELRIYPTALSVSTVRALYRARIGFA